MNDSLHRALDHAHLRHLNRLVALRRHGSYSAAGAALGLPPCSIAHSMRRLSAALGVEICEPCVRRRYAGVDLSPAGMRLADELTPIFEGIARVLAASR